jgi:hypothetical protein
VFFGLKNFSTWWQNGFTHPLSLLFCTEIAVEGIFCVPVLPLCRLILMHPDFMYVRVLFFFWLVADLSAGIIL